MIALLLACGINEEEPVDTGVSTVLDDAAYRFCHEDGFDADKAIQWCRLLEDMPEDRCPGLRATCAGADPVQASAGCQPFGAGAAGGRDLAAPPDKPVEPLSCDDLPELGGVQTLLQWIVAAVVAAFVLVVFRLLWAWVGVGREPVRPRVVAVVEEETVPEPDDVPEVPSVDLLDAARRAVEDGRAGDAALFARAAALRKLGETGAIRLHPSRTDREYLRGVRRDPAVHEPLREVLGAVEDLRWGGRVLDLTLARSVLSAAEKVLVATLLLLIPLTASGADAFRFGPEGDAGLFDVLADHGHLVSWRLRGLDTIGDDADVDALVLDLSGVTPSEEDWTSLRAWVTDGGVLVVGGPVPWSELGTRVALEPNLRTALRIDGIDAPRFPKGPRFGWQDGTGVGWVEAIGPEIPPIALVDDTVRLAPGETRPVVQVVPLGAGVVVGLADERLLWNGSLVDPANEHFLGDLLLIGQAEHGFGLPTPTRVQLATIASAGAETPAQSLANARLLPFVLQLLAWWALVGLWLGWPFGPARDPAAHERLRFVDHIRALSLRWERLGASRHAAAAYAGLWLGRLGPDGLRRAARRAGWTRDDASALVARASAVVHDGDAADDPETDLQLVEDLWKATRRR